MDFFSSWDSFRGDFFCKLKREASFRDELVEIKPTGFHARFTVSQYHVSTESVEGICSQNIAGTRQNPKLKQHFDAFMQTHSKNIKNALKNRHVKLNYVS